MPAITSRKYNRGMAFVYGFLPGTEYFISQEQLAANALPTAWNSSIRDWALFPLRVAQPALERAAYADVNLVSVYTLTAPTKEKILVVLNWNDRHPDDPASHVKITVAHANGQSPTSLEGNTISNVQRNGADLVFELDIKNVDIIVLQ